jgi:membrane associated rhomboid family serine protease
VHTELTHLLSDVLPWLVLGLWLEPRSGSVRWAVWTGLAVALTVGLHQVAYPHQPAVYGLSAVVHGVAFAGLVYWGRGVRTDPRRWIVFGILAVLNVDELLRGQSAFRATVVEIGRSVRFVPETDIATTPVLHAAGAILGIVLGLTPRLGRARREQQELGGELEVARGVAR